MRMSRGTVFLVSLWLGWISCGGHMTQTAIPILSDGRYDSEFPNRDVSRQLKDIVESIKLLNSVAYYKSFVFPENSRIRPTEINQNTLKDKTIQQIYFSKTASGTGCIIFNDGSKLLLLTCAHIIDFPDTIIKYQNSDNLKKEFVQSISFKEKQTNYASDLPSSGEFEIVASDENADIALLGQKFTDGKFHNIPVFNYPSGKAKELEWGSFVYLLGFPRGYKMVTTGIVSDPNRGKDGSFLLDALFNRGFSGGIVLAVRDGVPNFEWVGIARSAAAEYDLKVKPPEHFDLTKYDDHLPYHGDLFVDQQVEIQYGITHIVPMETIQKFLRQNESKIRAAGYAIPQAMKTDSPTDK